LTYHLSRISLHQSSAVLSASPSRYSTIDPLAAHRATSVRASSLSRYRVTTHSAEFLLVRDDEKRSISVVAYAYPPTSHKPTTNTRAPLTIRCCPLLSAKSRNQSSINRFRPLRRCRLIVQSLVVLAPYSHSAALRHSPR
jgi:hypothetical protein